MSDPLQRAADAAGLLLTGVEGLVPGLNATEVAGRAMGEVLIGLVPGLRTLTSWGELIAAVYPEAADGMEKFRDAARDAEEEIELVGVGLSDWLRVMPNVNDTMRELDRRTRERMQAEREAAAEAAKAARESEAALRAEEAALLKELDLRMQIGAIMEERRQDMAQFALDSENAVLMLDRFGQEIDDLKRSPEIFLAMAKGVANVAAQFSGPMFSAISDVQGLISQGTKDELSQIETVIEARRSAGAAESAALIERRADLQETLIKQFKAEKAASIAEATINGAVATTQALTLGPLGVALAAAVAASTATQIAVIKSQKPPSFQRGGMVGDRIDGDHFMVAASRNEGILKPEGVAAAGGPAGVRALNDGFGMARQITIEIPGTGVIAQAIVNDPTAVRILARAVLGTKPRGGF